MMEVYFYIPVEKVENAVECGLKLSKWSEREVVIEGGLKKCIAALLNPKDDMGKYKSGMYRCIKIELSPGNCYVAERYFYEMGTLMPEMMELYSGSILPIENYIFGSYRQPECLITGTVMPQQIRFMGKRLDSPILFENSEQLYINNIMENFREEHGGFDDCLLYYFYCKLAQIGKVDKIENSKKSLAVFLDRASGKATVLRIPEIEHC